MKEKLHAETANQRMFRKYANGKELKRRMMEYGKTKNVFSPILPARVVNFASRFSLGRFFTISSDHILAPIEGELVLCYFMVSLIPLLSHFVHAASDIHWPAFLMFWSTAAFSLHIQYLLRQANPLSSLPLLLSLIPFPFVVFLSRDVHSITCLFFVVMVSLVHLQMNHCSSVRTIYIILVSAIYFVSCVFMKIVSESPVSSSMAIIGPLSRPVDLHEEAIICLAILLESFFINALHHYIIWFGVFHKAKEDMLKAGINTIQRETRTRTRMFVTPLEAAQARFTKLLKSDVIPQNLQEDMRAVQKHIKLAALHGNRADITVHDSHHDLKSFVMSALGQTESPVRPDGAHSGSDGSQASSSTSSKTLLLPINSQEAPQCIACKEILAMRGLAMGPATSTLPDLQKECPIVTRKSHSDRLAPMPLALEESALGPYMDKIVDAMEDIYDTDPAGMIVTPEALYADLMWLSKELDRYNIDLFAVEKRFGGHALTAVATVLFGRHDLYSFLRISPRRLATNVRQMEQAYTRTPYHNSTHAADVLATMNWYLCALPMAYRQAITSAELVATLLAAMVHDIGHPGGDNRLQTQLQTRLARLYNDESVLEHYHASYGWKMVTVDGCDLLEYVSTPTLKIIRQKLVGLVLATDMAKHVDYIGRLGSSDEAPQALTDSFNPNDEKQRMFWIQCLFKIADISNTTKHWALCRTWALHMMGEFFEHGDLERAMGIPISDLKDRNEAYPAKSQIGFLQYVIIPFVTVLGLRSTELRFLKSNTEYNLARWTELGDEERSNELLVDEIGLISKPCEL